MSDPTEPEPTRVQAVAPTGRPHPGDAPDDPTQRQPDGLGAETHQTFGVEQTRLQVCRSETTQPSAEPGTGLPVELAGDYMVERRLAEGGEAVVYLARPTRTRPVTSALPDLVAVKVYKPGFTVDIPLLETIVARGEFRYLPVLYAFGNIEERPGHPARGWEAMEYCQHGSLADVAKPLPDTRVRAIVTELADALDWLEQAGWRQMDFSPSNILIRHGGDHVEVVIADFGGVVGTGESQQFGHVIGKLRYLAPEAAFAEERAAESPWWSLGMIIHELLTGQLPAAWANARNLRTLRSVLSTIEPDAGDLPEAWRLAATGLLTKDKPYRWGVSQLRAWLAGGTPEVRRGTASAPKIWALRYLGVDYTDRTVLAVALADDGERAIDWLTRTADRAAHLMDWFCQDFADELGTVDWSGSGVVAGDRLVAAHLIAVLAAIYAPATRPRYRGVVVDAAGLVRIAQDNTELLVELLQGETPYDSARHDCVHRTCTGGCVVLRRIAAEVPQVVRRAERLCRDLGQNWDRASAYREAVLLIADQQATRPALPQDKRYEPDWWRLLHGRAKNARLSTLDGLADIVVAILLAGAARAAIDTARAYRPGQPGSYLLPGSLQDMPRFPVRRAVRPLTPWITVVIWVGIVVATAHALGAWLVLDVDFAGVYESRLWPDAWTFVRGTVGTPVGEFTAAHPLPDPMSDVLAPLLAYERERMLEPWMLAMLPLVSFVLWLVSRRGDRWGRRFVVPPTVALVTVAVLNAYANGAYLMLVGLLAPLLGSGLGIAALILFVIAVGWLTSRAAPTIR